MDVESDAVGEQLILPSIFPRQRRANWKPKAPKYTKGLLKLYSQHAVSPMKGAYME